eukprot:6382855-Amphidinium_carterae.1
MLYMVVRGNAYARVTTLCWEGCTCRALNDVEHLTAILSTIVVKAVPCFKEVVKAHHWMDAIARHVSELT